MKLYKPCQVVLQHNIYNWRYIY